MTAEIKHEDKTNKSHLSFYYFNLNIKEVTVFPTFPPNIKLGVFIMSCSWKSVNRSIKNIIYYSYKMYNFNCYPFSNIIYKDY